jgi:hypothetical protein
MEEMLVYERALCDATVSILTSNEHHADGKDLFCISVWCHVAKPHRCETAECEVEGGDVS